MATVQQVIRSLFPRGTGGGKRKDGNLWHEAPRVPSDLFGAMAHLVELSGAYEIVQPSPSARMKYNHDPLSVCHPAVQRELQRIGRAWMYFLPYFNFEERRKFAGELAAKEALHTDDVVKKKKKDGLEKQGRYYFTIDELLGVERELINARWRQVVKSGGQSDIGRYRKREIAATGDIPKWWKPAVELLIIADEAAQRAGYFRQRPSAGGNGKDRPLTLLEYVIFEMAYPKETSDDKSRMAERGQLQSITSELFDSSIVGVLPKALSPSVGCSIRSLSHNLALVPPAGKLGCSWFLDANRMDLKPGVGEGAMPLNLLLIPFPYQVEAECFETAEKHKDLRGNWNWFRVKQRWLQEARPSEKITGGSGDLTGGLSSDHEEVVDWLMRLVRRGRTEQGGLHGVVLPELSLSYTLFRRFADRLLAETEVEFVIAGIGQNQQDDGSLAEGNFVAMFGRTSNQSEDWDYEFIRSKHHRWNMDARQFKRYGLTHRLKGAKSNSWWEAIDVSSREIDIVEPRAGSCMTVLICEDLARIDPCQEAIRAIGPNLVIALLMDGPQSTSRWPAYYAGVLADDPGSSVLTFTSLGLINRSLATSPNQSRSIGLWKDAFGGVAELQLPVGADALVVSLAGKVISHRSLDNRPSDGRPYTWTLGDVVPVAMGDRLRGNGR